MVPQKQKISGFTLIELLIAVAIVAILVAIALPSYQDSVRKANRGDAQGKLLENMNFMERVFTESNTYVLGASLALPHTSAKNYNLGFSAGPAASTYTLQAAPSGDQMNDPCETLTLSNTGAKGAATGGCW
ncbi:MAG: hypothetical protein COB23_02145 [Methylophaga sp.]|nr:MAG: hypothetical protein COB23_02145 [Methylophaga sp.]